MGPERSGQAGACRAGAVRSAPGCSGSSPRGRCPGSRESKRISMKGDSRRPGAPERCESRSGAAAGSHFTFIGIPSLGESRRSDGSRLASLRPLREPPRDRPRALEGPSPRPARRAAAGAARTRRVGSVRDRRARRSRPADLRRGSPHARRPARRPLRAAAPEAPRAAGAHRTSSPGPRPSRRRTSRASAFPAHARRL